MKHFIHKHGSTMLTLALIIALCIVVGCHLYGNHKQYKEWTDTRAILDIIVDSGDTLYKYSATYKPTWMTLDEYCCELQALNGMTSSDIYVGQHIQVYACCTHYTVDGLCLDEYIVTADGNEWLYDTDIRGCVSITFSDNGTDDIYDDVIIDIEKIG